MNRHHYDARVRLSNPSAADLDEQEIADATEEALAEKGIHDDSKGLRLERAIDVAVVATDQSEPEEPSLSDAERNPGMEHEDQPPRFWPEGA